MADCHMFIHLQQGRFFKNYCVNRPFMKSTVSGKRICLRDELETTLIRRKDFSTPYLNCSIMYTSVKGGFIENHTTAFRFQRREINSLFPRDRTWMQGDIRFHLRMWNWYEWSKANLTVTLNTISSFLVCNFHLPGFFFLQFFVYVIVFIISFSVVFYIYIFWIYFRVPFILSSILPFCSACCPFLKGKT